MFHVTFASETYICLHVSTCMWMWTWALGCIISAFHTGIAVKTFESCWARAHRSKASSKLIAYLYTIWSQEQFSNNVRVLSHPNTNQKCSGSFGLEGDWCGSYATAGRKAFRAANGFPGNLSFPYIFRPHSPEFALRICGECKKMPIWVVWRSVRKYGTDHSICQRHSSRRI